MSEQKYAIKGGFFNSKDGDRKYNAEDMNRPYKRIIAEGIFATQEGTPSTDLQVLSANNEMNIIVKAGDGMLGGKWFENTADIAITVSNNTSIVPRIDSIIIQIDKTQNGRTPNIIYREGIANSNPNPPELNNTENIVERRVANIQIPPSANYIGQELITDLRGSSECPWITSLIKQVDTSTLFLQWQAAYKKYYEEKEAEHNTYFDNLKNEASSFFTEEEQAFNNWFNKMKDQLTEDAAGNLQSEIDEIKQTQQDTLHEIYIGKKEDAPPSAKLVIEDGEDATNEESIVKFKDPISGEYKEVRAKGRDTLPAGAIIEYDGENIPEGYVEVEDDGEVYSTEEKRVGTWIDGKPIYRKCFTGTTSETYHSVVLSNTSNIEKIISTKGFIFQHTVPRYSIF